MTSYLAYKRKLVVLDEDKIIDWFTTKNGVHVPIHVGQTKEEALAELETHSTPDGMPKITVPKNVNIESLRREMTEFYKTRLQGTTVEHEKLGQILFSRPGASHVLRACGPEKTALVRHLALLIKTGETRGWEPLKKERPDSWSDFAFVENTVSINGKPRRVGVLIARNRSGKIFYDIAIPNEKAAAQTSITTDRADSSFTSDSIDMDEWIVNIFIDDEIELIKDE